MASNIWPALRRGYRLRILGGSNDRFYHFWFEASDCAVEGVDGDFVPMYQMGSDGGTFDQLVPIDFEAVADSGGEGVTCHTQGEQTVCPLLLAPADRAELLVDFSGWAWQTLLKLSFITFANPRFLS